MIIGNYKKSLAVFFMAFFSLLFLGACSETVQETSGDSSSSASLSSAAELDDGSCEPSEGNIQILAPLSDTEISRGDVITVRWRFAINAGFTQFLPRISVDGGDNYEILSLEGGLDVTSANEFQCMEWTWEVSEEHLANAEQSVWLQIAEYNNPGNEELRDQIELYIAP
jgi:hypothetical protein